MSSSCYRLKAQLLTFKTTYSNADKDIGKIGNQGQEHTIDSLSVQNRVNEYNRSVLLIRTIEYAVNRINYYDMALKSFKFKQPVSPTVLTDLELKQLNMPVLFIVGEHEIVYDAKTSMSRIEKVNSHIKIELFPNTGHDLMFTHTDLFNAKALEFLDDSN